MAEKKFTKIFRRRQRQSAGFTLIELLVSVAIGWIVISGLLYFIVQMLETNQKEFALAQTQVEMDDALSYIKTELEDAAYVYEGDCLTGRGTAGNSDYCSGLANWIAFPAGVTPVLAFWKLEQLPYREDPSAAQDLPAIAACGTNGQCINTLLMRNSYTLVVYSLSTQNASNIWNSNLARITRYELRQFDPDALATAVSSNPQRTTQGWVNPTTDASFGSWPRKNDGTLSSGATAPAGFSDVVLVDLVDFSVNNNSPACPSGYNISPPNALNIAKNGSAINSFYACVGAPSPGNGQDVIVYLRGNAKERAGGKGNTASYTPLIQTRVQTRAVFQRKPPSID